MTKLGFVVYPVIDLEKSKAFYRDAVGLGEASTLHERWAEFELDGGVFALATGGEAIGIAPGSAFAVAFEVDDFDASLERLRAHGGNAEEPFEAPTCRACFARDPDGNRFSLHKLKT